MTLTDIEKILGIWHHRPIDAVKALVDKMPSLKAKTYNGKLYKESHLSWEEVEVISHQMNLNELQIMLLKEHYKDKPDPDIYEIQGTHKFLKEYKTNPDIKCCNTCKFLIGMTGSHKMPKPYCKVYEKYLASIDAKVYEYWCSSYLKANLPKPRQWYKENAPINLNMYGETGTINGIDNSKMMNTERSIKGVVVRVNQVGFDD